MSESRPRTAHHSVGSWATRRPTHSRQTERASGKKRLRDEYSIYAVDTGRICVAALNDCNLDYLVDAIAAVMR